MYNYIKDINIIIYTLFLLFYHLKVFKFLNPSAGIGRQNKFKLCGR